jgi:hypothetical protein
MTATTLSQMTHHDLVDYVQTRITGTGPTTTYLRHAGAPKVNIKPYPKRRRTTSTVSRPAFDALPTVAGPSYEDFFVTDSARARMHHIA